MAKLMNVFSRYKINLADWFRGCRRCRWRRGVEQAGLEADGQNFLADARHGSERGGVIGSAIAGVMLKYVLAM
ncbi:oxaloacetate decarboxylase [Klebsiella pneumoniae]|nr:oxaloacetate decarboxylase [Klebsiella pneumoniae]